MTRREFSGIDCRLVTDKNLSQTLFLITCRRFIAIDCSDCHSTFHRRSCPLHLLLHLHLHLCISYCSFSCCSTCCSSCCSCSTSCMESRFPSSFCFKWISYPCSCCCYCCCCCCCCCYWFPCSCCDIVAVVVVTVVVASAIAAPVSNIATIPEKLIMIFVESGDLSLSLVHLPSILRPSSSLLSSSSSSSSTAAQVRQQFA